MLTAIAQSTPSAEHSHGYAPAIQMIIGDETSSDFEALYASRLAYIRAATVRNRNHDGSVYRNIRSEDLILPNHYGSREEYLDFPGGNPESSFPTLEGGQNRTACEFSHFAYDDPIIFPGKPGASHLHMFFGNTDVNAYSTYDTLINSGSGTCNGQELNRTGYWVPALFDDQGNVRVPERIVVYYKGGGLDNGGAEIYPEGAAMVAKTNINTIDTNSGGAQGVFSFKCSDQYSGDETPSANTMPVCDGDRYLQSNITENTNKYAVLEINVKFPQCWNRQDPANPDNWSIPQSSNWYASQCDSFAKLPNMEYFVNYRVEPGESTANWFLSSDVDMQTFETDSPAGASIHGDWWGGWNKDINQLFIDNCVNFRIEGEASGCGFGYLTNGGPDNSAPYAGPALKLRPQYTGPQKVSAETLFNELCETDRNYTRPEDAAFCNPLM